MKNVREHIENKLDQRQPLLWIDYKQLIDRINFQNSKLINHVFVY